MTDVVTYRLAHLDRHVRLCARHTGDRRFGTLGPVSAGLHRATCDACTDDDARRQSVDDTARVSAEGGTR